MLINCSTDIAVFLIGLKNEDGVFYYYAHPTGLAGIHIQNKRLLPINDQIIKRMQSVLTELDLEGKVSVIQEFCDPLYFENGQSGSLYLGHFEGEVFSPDENWKMLPDILRSMPTDDNQLAYMRAFQVFAGGFGDETKAVDIQEAIRHLDLNN